MVGYNFVARISTKEKNWATNMRRLQAQDVAQIVSPARQLAQFFCFYFLIGGGGRDLSLRRIMTESYIHSRLPV